LALSGFISAAYKNDVNESDDMIESADANHKYFMSNRPDKIDCLDMDAGKIGSLTTPTIGA